jgi:hypothetical protein
MRSTRLNPLSGIREYVDDPTVAAARKQVKQHVSAAAANLTELLARAA